MFKEKEQVVLTETGVEREGLRRASQHDVKCALSTATELDG